jgi:Tfp pilus assembly protein FimT
MKFAKIITLAVIGAFALPALAQTSSTPRIDQRQKEQERRIDQGERSGALTQKEAARLDKGQANVRRLERKAVADGKVTRNERARLERAQNRESRKIEREKRDGQTR